MFRIGINLGDVVVEGEDLLGDGVNVAARLEQLCEPGGVLVSGTAYDHLQGRLGLPLEFVGERQVKNIERRCAPTGCGRRHSGAPHSRRAASPSRPPTHCCGARPACPGRRRGRRLVVVPRRRQHR